MRPSVDDLLRTDSRIKIYKLIAVFFVVGPLLLVAFEHPHDFVRQYMQTMLFAFSWPLLTLLVLYVVRRRFLVRLAQEGRECRGIVKSHGGRPSARVAQISARIEGQERLINIYVPARMWLAENREVNLLVDPISMTKGVILSEVDG